jgi:hypothetical protein
MSINFSNSTGANLSGVGNRISSYGNVIQVVEIQYNSAMSTSNTSNTAFFSGQITLQNSTNGIAYYYHTAQRCDAGDGPWNLGYHSVYCNGSNLANSSWNGFTTNNIITYSRMGYTVPGSVGPHTFQIYAYAYPGCNVQFNSPGNQANEGVAVLRLMEIQTSTPSLS